jgi:hypothetical protein
MAGCGESAARRIGCLSDYSPGCVFLRLSQPSIGGKDFRQVLGLAGGWVVLLLGSVMPACGGGALRAGIFIANVVRWKKSHNPKRRSGNGSAWWDRLPAGKWQFAGGKTLCVAEGLT